MSVTPTSTKLIAECRIKHNDVIYEKGNTFLCHDSNEAANLIKDGFARAYPQPTPGTIHEEPVKDYEINESFFKKPIKGTKSHVTIVTAIKDNLPYLKQCIEAVYLNTKTKFEYIIIDNGSGREVKEYLIALQHQQSNVHVITNSENKGYAYACNQGIKLARYNYICMLDADTYVAPGWLEKLLKTFSLFPKCGVAVPSQAANTGAVYIDFKLRNPENIQIELRKLTNYLAEEYEEKQIFQIYGFCHLVKKEVYQVIGVYDWKRYQGLASNETDLFWRAGLKGYKLYWAKGSYVHHFHNKIKLALGLNPSEMADKGHAKFRERQQHPEDYFVKNDAVIMANIEKAYAFNETYKQLKPFFNE